VVTTQFGWAFRLTIDGHSHVLWSHQGGRWVDLYDFSLLPRTFSDVVVLHHFGTTHPDSILINHFWAYRFGTTARWTFWIDESGNGMLIERRADRSTKRRRIPDDTQHRVLADHLGIRLPSGYRLPKPAGALRSAPVSERNERNELLVVGAGPVGLSAALAARSLGIGVTVLEAEPADRVRPGSRALFVHHDTLRRLDRMSPGLAGRSPDSASSGAFGGPFYRGREVFARRHETPGTAGLPPYTSLRQVDTEAFLLDACREAGIDVAWDARITDVRTTPDHVRATAADGRSWKCALPDRGGWQPVGGAAGARHPVAGAGTGQGERSTDYRVAVDLADGDSSPSAERLCHYRHPGMAGRNLFVVPFSGGRQVDVQCIDPADADRLSDADEVRRWLPRVVEPDCVDRVLWVARYPCLQLVAESFVDDHRRSLLAGEAAHLFAPLGARGMNSGIADADAAAAAVAVALRATNNERAAAAVEDFDLRRRQAALHNRDAAGAALRHLRADTAIARTRLAVAGRLAPHVPRCGAWLDRAPFGPRGPVTVRDGRY
jgi:3-(3-hydroxy-phenyl)propionate hydroxylase